MWFQRPLSRRQFVSTVASLTAASYLAKPLFGSATSTLEFFSPTPATGTLPWGDQGVLNLSSSPYAKLKNVPVRAVTIREGFWSGRRQTNVERSIPTMHDQLEAHGAWTTSGVRLRRVGQPACH